MAAKDVFHNAVRQALINDGWTITHDPLRLQVDDDIRALIDLGAEKLIGAERAGDYIGVEIKSFISESLFYEFHLALGQFINYRELLRAAEPQRVLYLAVPVAIYDSFFTRRFVQNMMESQQLQLLVFDAKREVIVKWIK